MMVLSPTGALSTVIRDLAALKVGYALVGGLAVSVRGEVRFTRDIDIAIGVDSDAGAEALIFELARLGYRVVATIEQSNTGRLATARLETDSDILLDLIFATTGIEPDIVRRATTIDLPGAGRIPVASPEDLLVMKVLSMSDERPQDRMDARGLLRANPDLDLDAVRQSLQKIEESGNHRQQDLAAKLDSLISRLSQSS